MRHLSALSGNYIPLGTFTLALCITICYFRHLKYLPKSGPQLQHEISLKAWQGRVQVTVSKEQEHSCLTPTVSNTSLPKADKYAHRFCVRRCKIPLVEILCPLEDQTQKQKPNKFYRRLSCTVSKTQRRFALMESLILSSLCLWSYLFVALPSPPGSLCKHPTSLPLHSHTRLLAAPLAVQELLKEHSPVTDHLS